MIVINVQPVPHRLDNYALVFIRNEPMKLSGRQPLAKRSIGYIHVFKKSPCFGDIGAFSEQHRNKFILSDVVFSVRRFAVKCVSDKIQPRRAKSLFVCRIVKKRIPVQNVCRAYKSIMP